MSGDLRAEFGLVSKRFPDRLPVIIQPRSHRVPSVCKHKFVVPPDLLASQLLLVVRKRLRLDGSLSIFFFVDNVVVVNSTTIRELHQRHKDTTNGFLYLTYDTDDAFGGGVFYGAS